MPEEQNVRAEWWNRRVNRFLSDVLHWQQLGSSNVDIKCDQDNDNVGIDSVFSYRSHERTEQQIVIVEAKIRGKFEAVNRAELQKWVDRLIKKVECAPKSREFAEKFAPSVDAQFGVGMLVLWVSDASSFDGEVFERRLELVEMPSKTREHYLFILDNRKIAQFCAIHDELQRLRSTGSYESIRFYMPSNGSDLICDGSTFPLEAVYSDVIIFRTLKKENAKNANTYQIYESSIVFYFGRVSTSYDLAFIDLIIRDLGIHDTTDIDVYLDSPLEPIRSEIEAHSRNSKFRIRFKNLLINEHLPSWLGEDD